MTRVRVQTNDESWMSDSQSPTHSLTRSVALKVKRAQTLRVNDYFFSWVGDTDGDCDLSFNARMTQPLSQSHDDDDDDDDDDDSMVDHR